jgi:hypothetical protein
LAGSGAQPRRVIVFYPQRLNNFDGRGAPNGPEKSSEVTKKTQ